MLASVVVVAWMRLWTRMEKAKACSKREQAGAIWHACKSDVLLFQRGAPLVEHAHCPRASLGTTFALVLRRARPKQFAQPSSPHNHNARSSSKRASLFLLGRLEYPSAGRDSHGASVSAKRKQFCSLRRTERTTEHEESLRSSPPCRQGR